MYIMQVVCEVELRTGRGDAATGKSLVVAVETGFRGTRAGVRSWATKESDQSLNVCIRIDVCGRSEY